jgi:serine kinase of HPr protein (carbohydrate metabolism regulator)
MTSTILHATSVAITGQAVLIRGEPGSGKSTLALELLEQWGTGLGDGPLSATLIADDQTELTLGEDRLWCAAPKLLAGALEVRGLGLVKVPFVGPVPLCLVVDLASSDAAPRMPVDDDPATTLLGVSVPRLILDRHGRALASRVRAAFRRL